MIEFEVLGLPKPKGSTKSYPYRRKDGKLGVSTTNSCPGTAEWEERVRTEAGRAVPDGPVAALDKGCAVTLFFLLPRPQYLRKKDACAIKRPDIDKLARAVLDGLTGPIVRDDSLIVSLVVDKDYCQGNERAGCLITVEPREPRRLERR
jgi:Holliday junction resolvase RusA-like endonuclease